MNKRHLFEPIGEVLAIIGICVIGGFFCVGVVVAVGGACVELGGPEVGVPKEQRESIVEELQKPNSTTRCQENLAYFKDNYGNCFAACEWTVWMEYGGQGLTTIPCDKMPPPETEHSVTTTEATVRMPTFR